MSIKTHWLEEKTLQIFQKNLIHSNSNKEQKQGPWLHPTEHTVIASIGLEQRNTKQNQLIVMAAGTKCLGENNRRNGHNVMDMHAEVLCKRAFQQWLLMEMGKKESEFIQRVDGQDCWIPEDHSNDQTPSLPSNHEGVSLPSNHEGVLLENDSKDQTSSLPSNHEGLPGNNEGLPMNNEGLPMNNEGLPMNNEGLGKENRLWEWKTEYRICFYVNRAPCGDASIHSLVGRKRKATETGAKKFRKLLNGTIEIVEERFTELQDTYCCRLKPGRGHRSLSMSCSDKIAKWMCLGLTGSLISRNFQKPVLIDEFIIGDSKTFDKIAAERALIQRASKEFEITTTIIHPCNEKDKYVENEKRRRAWAIAFNYFEFDASIEVLDKFGYKMGTSKKSQSNPKCFSRLSNVKLFSLWRETVHSKEDSLEKTSPSSSSCWYQKMKTKFRKLPAFRNWISLKPDCHQQVEETLNIL